MSCAPPGRPGAAGSSTDGIVLLFGSIVKSQFDFSANLFFEPISSASFGNPRALHMSDDAESPWKNRASGF
jgi:hypothetical protein